MPGLDANQIAILDLEDLAMSPLLNAAGRAFVSRRLAERRRGLALWPRSQPPS